LKGYLLGCERFEDLSKCENVAIVNVISCKEGVGQIEAFHCANVNESKCM
jgi:uracil phosphoribosyltransferase